MAAAEGQDCFQSVLCGLRASAAATGDCHRGGGAHMARGWGWRAEAPGATSRCLVLPAGEGREAGPRHDDLTQGDGSRARFKKRGGTDQCV